MKKRILLFVIPENEPGTEQFFRNVASLMNEIAIQKGVLPSQPETQGESRIRMEFSNGSEEDMAKVAQNPDGYFILVPFSPKSKSRKCVVCSPHMSRQFSNGLGNVVGAMVQACGSNWVEPQLRSFAGLMVNWLSRMTDQKSPNLMPWGKQPKSKSRDTESAQRRKRHVPHSSRNIPVGGGCPLKAVRVWGRP